jgi:hypothetical protein
MAEAREFRPAPPGWRDIAPVAFLGLLLLILIVQTLRERISPSPVGLTGTALLVAGGCWLLLRLRFPGSPRLRVDGEGMSYTRSGRARGLRWNDVVAIFVDHTRSEMRFIPGAGGAPIVMHRDMVASDGQRFDMLIEDYWQPPEDS